MLSDSFYPARTDEPVWEITVGGMLRDVSARHGEREALVEVRQDGTIGRRWTYVALLADCERLALALATRFAPGERVAVWAPNCPEWVMMEFACGLAGLVLVTANPALQVKELRYVVEQSGAAALFRAESFRGNPMAEIAAEACAGLDGIREITDLEDTASLHRQGDRPDILPDVAPETAAQIQYTSGTTGFPKGAVLSHRGLVNNARFYASRCGVTAETVWINVMPMFHTSGCGMVTLGCLQAGARMVLIGLFDPAVVVERMESEGVSMLLCVPTMLVALLEAQEAAPRDLSALDYVSCGGSMVAPELVRRVRETFGCGYGTLYGQTEYCPVITQHHRDDAFDDICGSTGRPLPQTDVSIRSTGDNAVVTVGASGEICVRGPCTMLGYNGDAEATAAAIDADGWLHTGDLGIMDARGYVQVTGRVKEMIIRGGENHFPVEIENVLLEHPDVAEVAVVGLPDARWGEIIAAFVRTQVDKPLDVDGLRAHCRAEMSPQKTPTVWERVEGFPLTGSGKIQKFKLRDAWVADRDERD